MMMERVNNAGEQERRIEAWPEESLFIDGGSWLRGRLLGKGGFGAVHLAHFPNHTALSARFKGFPSLVAVKSAGESKLEDLAMEKMFYESLGQSPFLIRCFGDDATVAHDATLLYKVFLEYASAGTLFDLIAKSNYLGLLESQVRALTRFILGGVNHIHRAGFVHCDLKPENVLLVEDGQGQGQVGFVAKIGDLGLAKNAQRSDVPVRGTRMYLAPECYKQGIQGQASDVWALGCIVFSMLTGTLKWKGAPRIQELADHYLLSGHKISKEAEDFVRKCLSWEPSDRPSATMLLGHPFVQQDQEWLRNWRWSMIDMLALLKD